MNFSKYKKIFITGIDTGVGKTYATGFIAKNLTQNGINVVTQKLVQTGCTGIADDILKHREIAEMELLDDDINLTTCAYTFPFPASPHLSAQLQGAVIDIEKININTSKLQKKYDMVLIEGAGGIFAPITSNYFTINYIVDQKLPVIIVTTPKLGSINHTLLTLEACITRNIEVIALIYNQFQLSSVEITNDTKKVFKNYLSDKLPDTEFIEIEEL